MLPRRVAVWGLFTDRVWVSQAFYAWAWWAWILLLDAFCVWRRGSSLLTTRRPLLGLLATSSVTFWFLFELLNLRFQNWYYVGTFELAEHALEAGDCDFVGAARQSLADPDWWRKLALGRGGTELVLPWLRALDGALDTEFRRGEPVQVGDWRMVRLLPRDG